DEPPLGLARALGLAPAGVSGTMSGRLTLAVPFDGARTWQELAPVVSAEMRDVAMPGVLRDWSLTGGTMKLTFDRRAARIAGDARIQGIPVTVSWSEELVGKAPRRQVDVSGRADAGAFAALGFAPVPGVEGPVAMTARYNGPPTWSGKVA